MDKLREEVRGVLDEYGSALMKLVKWHIANRDTEGELKKEIDNTIDQALSAVHTLYKKREDKIQNLLRHSLACQTMHPTNCSCAKNISDFLKTDETGRKAELRKGVEG